MTHQRAYFDAPPHSLCLIVALTLPNRSHRTLRDMNLFESGMNKISKYAEQMNRWFPDAPYPCVAGEVRRYNKGYLGDEPFEKWDRKVFRARMEDKQSMDGFERLTELCSMLLEELAQELKTGKLKG